MTLLGLERMEQFAKKHPPARTALRKRRNVIEEANWANSAQMKQTFRTADMVGDQVVFNVGGNKYRLIALVDFEGQMVLIQDVLAHDEYDEGGWKQ